MYSFFSPFPYVRLLIYWVLGTLLARYCPVWAWAPLACFGIGIGFFQSEFFIALVFITLSIFRFDQVDTSCALSPDTESRSSIIQVQGQPVEKASTWSVLGRAIALRDQGAWIPASGFWKVYFEKSGRPPQPGEKYAVTGYLNPIAPPIFPGGMNWPAYYAQKGVSGQIYAKKGQWERLSSVDNSFDWLMSCQRYFRKAIQRAIPAGVNRDVAEAMFLGVSSTIDFETMQRYASLGAIHILSVSGLHVGFLYLGLAFIFGFLRRWRWAHFLLIMVFLWAYAGMTGFSGPVLRSAWMFSVLLGAKSFRQPQRPVNTLAFSCLVLVIWDPQFLFLAGFQLSYAAVLGLILFQEEIKTWYSSSIWIINQVWEVTCVALAAQVLTWPLVLYYFHQFPHPVYFFLLNPVLILLSSITLAIGFIFLALSPFAFAWLGSLLALCFQAFHGLLFFVADYFHPVISFLQFDFWELIGYYVLVCLAAAWWRYRKLFLIYFMISTMIVFFVSRCLWEPSHGMYLSVHQGRAIAVQVSGAHAILYGNMKPAWVQANVIPMLTRVHVQDTVSHDLPVAWSYDGQIFYVAQKPCRPISPIYTHLIIEPSKTFPDLRWLAHWPHAHWYFVRRPSAYRLGQLRGLPSRGITFLSEGSAVYFKKKAALGRQPDLN